MAWRPTEVVLSADGVCRADEDELCRADEDELPLTEPLDCLVEDAGLVAAPPLRLELVELCLVEDVPVLLSCDAELFLFVTEDDGLEAEVCRTVDRLSDDEVLCEADELTDELRLVEDEDCLADDEDCLVEDEDCLADEDDCLVDDEDCLVDDEVVVRRLWAYPSVWNAANAMSIAAIAARYVLIIIVFAETYMPEAQCSIGYT